MVSQHLSRLPRSFFLDYRANPCGPCQGCARYTVCACAPMSLSLFPDHYHHHHLFYQVAGRLCLLKNSWGWKLYRWETRAVGLTVIYTSCHDVVNALIARLLDSVIRYICMYFGCIVLIVMQSFYCGLVVTGNSLPAVGRPGSRRFASRYSSFCWCRTRTRLIFIREPKRENADESIDPPCVVRSHL